MMKFFNNGEYSGPTGRKAISEIHPAGSSQTSLQIDIDTLVHIPESQ
jgi:hypothetical protein